MPSRPPARFTYAMEFILKNDAGETEPYEVRRVSDVALTREQLTEWAGQMRTEVVDRRSDVKNVLAMRIVVIRGRTVQGTIEVR